MIIGCLHHCSPTNLSAVRTGIRLLPVCRRKSPGCRASATRPGKQPSAAGAWAMRRCGAGRAAPRTTGTSGSTSHRTRSATTPAQRLGDTAGRFSASDDIGLEVVDAGQRAEVLPGDPSQPMNSCPRMADLGVVRALTKIGDACDRYRLQAPGGLDTYVCFQATRGAGAVAGEQPVYERHAMLRPRLVQEEVQAMLAKPWAAPGREWLAVRTRSSAIRRDDALHGRIARAYGVDRID